MSVTPAMSIYESTFSQSDTTDAILVVEGKKLHVNKAVLSFHSDYFNTLFNGEFKDKSMQEISIKDVKFEDFAATLSLLYPSPIKPTGIKSLCQNWKTPIFPEENVERLLEIADRFLISSVKYTLELYVKTSNKDKMDKIRIADKYKLQDLMYYGIRQFTSCSQFKGIKRHAVYNLLSDKAKLDLLSYYFTLAGYD
ncbi:hypothetical protein CRE_09858 [Caenorhabditis remanei]|uniref:BTB domain-containing protein n=1 Tax=Caenorhabditis remanei TaxID=31234 RepID=E3NKJ4_CAERE|nr:hypothetical protein CRE_09858 [Caenorhabditis remanei]